MGTVCRQGKEDGFFMLRKSSSPNMRVYEGLFIFPPDSGPDAKKKQCDQSIWEENEKERNGWNQAAWNRLHARRA